MASPCISPEGLSVRTDRYWPSGDNRGLLTRERLAKALTGRSPAVAPEAGVAGSDVDAAAVPQAQANASSAKTASFRANMRPSPSLPVPRIAQAFRPGTGTVKKPVPDFPRDDDCERWLRRVPRHRKRALSSRVPHAPVWP